MSEEKDAFVNPIDPEKIAENPGLLPYAHSVGGAVVKPVDKGKITGLAVAAMEEQTDAQLKQIYQQIEVLAKQAREIKTRKEISYLVYQADFGFSPIIGRTYYFYRKPAGEHTLSLISPEEWGTRLPYTWLATLQLLSDHTWDIKSWDPQLFEV